MARESPKVILYSTAERTGFYILLGKQWVKTWMSRYIINLAEESSSDNNVIMVVVLDHLVIRNPTRSTSSNCHNWHWHFLCSLHISMHFIYATIVSPKNIQPNLLSVFILPPFEISFFDPDWIRIQRVLVYKIQRDTVN